MLRLHKCVFIYVNSVVSRHRIHYLNLFLREHRPDVMMLAEYRLNPRHNLYLSDYEIYRQDRWSRYGGGIAVIVRDALSCNRVNLDLGNVEYTAVSIYRADGSSLHIIDMYRRPQVTLGLNNLDSLLDLTFREPEHIGADLNAKHPDWGGNINNRIGVRLREFLFGYLNLGIRRSDGPT